MCSCKNSVSFIWSSMSFISKFDFRVCLLLQPFYSPVTLEVVAFDGMRSAGFSVEAGRRGVTRVSRDVGTRH